MRLLAVRAALIAGFFAALFLVSNLLDRTKPFEVQRQLSEANPIRQQYESDVRSFNDEGSIWIGVHSQVKLAPERIFALSSELENFLLRIPGVEKVQGPANAKYFFHDGAAVTIENFVTSEGLAPKALGLLSHELWRNQLVNEDFQSFLMRYHLSPQLPRDSEKPVIDRAQSYLKLLSNPEEQLELHQIGVKVASAAFLEEMNFQQSLLTPLLLLGILVFFYWLFRSWVIVFWSFMVIFVCYVTLLVLIVLVEGGLGPYSSFALMFTFIVATSDLIHFFSRFQQLEGSVEDRLKKTLEIAYLPCLLTSLSTAAGFLALVMNVNESIRQLGIYCAIACLLEWALIFYVLPPVMRVFGFRPKQKRFDVRRLTTGYFGFLQRFKVPIIAVSVASILLGAIFTLGLLVDDNFYTKFEKNHPLSQSIDFFSKHFQFVGSVDVVVKIPNEELFSGETFASLSELERDLRELPTVSRLRSLRQVNDVLVQQLKNSNTDLNPSDLNRTRISALELFKAYGEFDELYDAKGGQIRIIVFLKSFATADFENVLTSVYSLQNKYKGRLELRPGGFSVLRSYINNRVIKDFFESFVLGFALIFICFLLLYRNVKWALLALFPSAIPLLIVSGLIGFLKIPVGTDLIVVMCISFGISGDNTIHLAYVIQQLRTDKMNYQESLTKVMDLIGMAMIGSSAIFLFCLPIFLMGHLLIFQQIAIFLSISFFIAFFADVFVFPAFQLLSKDKLKITLLKRGRR